VPNACANGSASRGRPKGRRGAGGYGDFPLARAPVPASWWPIPCPFPFAPRTTPGCRPRPPAWYRGDVSAPSQNSFSRCRAEPDLLGPREGKKKGSRPGPAWGRDDATSWHCTEHSKTCIPAVQCGTSSGMRCRPPSSTRAGEAADRCEWTPVLSDDGETRDTWGTAEAHGQYKALGVSTARHTPGLQPRPRRGEVLVLGCPDEPATATDVGRCC